LPYGLPAWFDRLLRRAKPAGFPASDAAPREAARTLTNKPNRHKPDGRPVWIVPNGARFVTLYR